MKVVIVGAGSIGVALAQLLSREGSNEVVMIEADEDRARAVSEEVDALVLHGDGTQPQMLAKADVNEADALVAVTGSDAINTVIAMLGRRSDVPKIVVKLEDMGLRAACQEIGVSDIIAPTLASASRILSVLHGFHRIDFSVVSKGGLRLAELSGGKAAGTTLSDLALPEDVLVVMVLRDDQGIVPRGGTRIEADDTLLLLVENDEALSRAKKALGAQS